MLVTRSAVRCLVLRQSGRGPRRFFSCFGRKLSSIRNHLDEVAVQNSAGCVVALSARQRLELALHRTGNRVLSREYWWISK